MAERKRMSPVAMVLSVAFAIILVLGGQWYRYIEYSDSPYDEVGIAINNWMPGPIRAWGCAELDRRFPGNAVPPMGCERQ